MANSVIWGDKLRKLRKKADVTQGQLVEQLSHLANDLSDYERNSLMSIELYDEVSTYFGGILDTPTLSKLERGKRTLSRKRTVALIWGLSKLGVLETADEANHFLEAAAYGHLTPTEQNILFDTTPSPILKSHEAAAITPEPPKTPMVQRRLLPMIAGGMGILILGVLLGLLFPRFFGEFGESGGTRLGEPDFSDDFTATAINSVLWNGENATHFSVENGRLLFDTPVNVGAWYSEYVEPAMVLETLSRLSFDVVTNTPETYQAGAIGLSMSCWNYKGWLNVYAGGTPAQIFVEYSATNNPDWGANDVHTSSLRPIESGETYTVDLTWAHSEVTITINDKPVAEPIPCNRTHYFNIAASVGEGQKVRGTVDHIRAWY